MYIRSFPLLDLVHGNWANLNYKGLLNSLILETLNVLGERWESVRGTPAHTGALA